MNKCHNDYGMLVNQVGEMLCDADIENRFPQALSRIKSFYNHYPYSKAYNLIVQYLDRMQIDKATKVRIVEVASLSHVFEFDFD